MNAGGVLVKRLTKMARRITIIKDCLQGRHH